MKEDDQPIVLVPYVPETWDIKARRPVVVPDCPDDVSPVQAQALLQRMDGADHVLLVRMLATLDVIRAIEEGRGWYEPE
jgi:hypothetical protein